MIRVPDRYSLMNCQGDVFFLKPGTRQNQGGVLNHFYSTPLKPESGQISCLNKKIKQLQEAILIFYAHDLVVGGIG